MKKSTRFAITLLFVTALTGCQKKIKDAVIPLHSSSYNLKAMADKVMERVKLQTGEKVFMIGQPGEFDSLVVLLSDRIALSGGVYLGTINVDTSKWPQSWNTDFTRLANGLTKDKLTKLFDSLAIDLGIMLPGATPQDAPYGAWQDVLNKGKGRSVHFHWTGANDINGNPIPMDETIGRIYEHAILMTDYQSLSTTQQAFENAIRKDEVRILTGGGSLSFKIGDRPVTKQDGDASKERSMKGHNLIDREIEFPAGAIRVAPMEETIEGTITFPIIKSNDQVTDGLVVTFKKGKIIDIKAKEGLDFVKEKLMLGMDGNIFRELAVGFNPLLAISDENQRILHYGYGAGVVRIALGNNLELGGVVGGEVVLFTLFSNATVMVGKDVWVKDGKLLK